MKDLENSIIDRKNVLNNKLAVSLLENEYKFKGYIFQNEVCFLKSQVVDIFNTDIRTIEKIIEVNYNELKDNGYEILKGNKLDDFKKICYR